MNMTQLKKKYLRSLLFALMLCLSLVLGGCSPTLSSSLDSMLSSLDSPGTTAAQTADTSASSSGTMRVHFIDVGQGDSILVENEGHFMLIDAGENDKGRSVVSYLQQNGVTSLDYIIGTHPHSDHIGGLDDVIEAFDVEKIIMPPKEHTTATFEDVLDAIAEKGLKITKPIPGDSYSLGEAQFTILSPQKNYGDDLNNWSVGIRLSYGDNAFVMCGDAESKAEQDIVDSGLILSADVLKAGHHGSRTSTSSAFLKAVSPSFAVIQCGKDNSYGHPHKETMNRLNKAGVTVYRTDESGTIIAESNKKEITWSFSKAAGR